MKENKMGRTCRTYGEMRNAFIILVGKPDRKGPLGKTCA
jgi:hypothetical protein